MMSKKKWIEKEETTDSLVSWHQMMSLSFMEKHVDEFLDFITLFDQDPFYPCNFGEEGQKPINVFYTFYKVLIT